MVNLDSGIILIMRRLYRAKKDNQIELSPWPSPNQSNRSEFDQAHFRSISLLHPPNQTNTYHCSLSSHIPDNKFIRSHSSVAKTKAHPLNGKTISNFKDYYRKHYQTEQPEQFVEKSEIKAFKDIQQTTLKVLSKLQKQMSYKKTSVVDLTRSLNDNIVDSKCKTMILRKQQNKEHAYNRILKIKQDMIRNKQRRIIDKKRTQIREDELRPQSKSMPMRVKSPKKGNKMLFPDKNFGNLLSQFLQKVKQ